MKMRSTKAKKYLVENKTILKIGSYFTRKRIQPVFTETKQKY